MHFLKCPKCNKEYDKAQHFPKLVIPCGHPICLRCVPLLTKLRIWKCPTCALEYRGLYVSPPNNISMAQLLDNLQGLRSGSLNLTLRRGDSVLVYKSLPNIRTPQIEALLVSVAARGQLQKEFNGSAKWLPKNISVMQLLDNLYGLCDMPVSLTLQGEDGVLLSKDLPNSGDPLIKALLVFDGATPKRKGKKQKVKLPKDAAAQLARAQPARAQPETAQTATGLTATSQPAKGQTATAQPPKQKVKKERKRNQPKDAAAQPATAQPATAQSATAQPATGRMATGQLATGQPAKGQPATAQPPKQKDRLVHVRCDLHPETSLGLLQIASPSVVELSLVNPNAEHLSEVQNMPHLRRLSVHGFDASRGHMPLISLARRQLRWLRVRDLQDEALRRLLTAYTPPFSDALEELQLWVNTAPVALQRWETCCNTLLSLVYKLDLQELRKLVLKWGLSHPHDKNDCAAILCNLQEEMPKTEILCLDCGTWGAF
ncbi:hypothetical protein FOCC_FOCC005567 [Frankliniella occidentalis]|uniref:Uncharacterized protein LOC113217517 isoform X2 n=1 Tax=Frankliniella occidentalis TaxID=133901 RepID=A0A9C6TYR3_FRAOC|nr:uncharacterized protein LOC113217517 isoform X2 [Frankliniella occidentalis]KAE8747744.1 hypothetical protein FOCC_FOCC005567 [Frankliniella occidentalis]